MTSDPSSQQPISNTGDVTSKAQQDRVEATFPIVGIAASAGGLEAFMQLLSHLPTDTGMAFVLIQHLSAIEVIERSAKAQSQLIEDMLDISRITSGKLHLNTRLLDLVSVVDVGFRQGDSSTTKAKQGLGLGLSIVRHLVELHGGTVRAESPGVGRGTTITVRLPLRSMPLFTLPSDLEPTAEEPLEAVIQEVFSLEGLRILAVDDDPDSLKLMQYMLEDVGAEVVAVTSVREAIAALMASPGRYDVLLADIGMPGEDGFSLIRQVRALSPEAGSQIPAAAITAYVNEREQQLGIKAGFQIHLPKPVDSTQLIRVVANLTGRVTEE